MTREEAIKILSSRDGHGIPSGYNGGYAEAIDLAIEALKAVGEIKEIINVSNFLGLLVIQEDVLKYKMICEVVERMDGGENEL